MRAVRITLRNYVRPGWTFLCGGGSSSGLFLTQEDDKGELWLTRMWSLGPLILSLDVHVPMEAAGSISRGYIWREQQRMEETRKNRNR